MIIRIHEIPEEGLEVEGDDSADVLELEEAEEIGEIGPIHYELTLQVVSDEVVAKGQVHSRMQVECSRCGVFFWTNCGNSAFLRVFQIKPGSDELDITSDLREAVLLGIPTHPLCSEDCKGLCPYCGINLNEASCECEPPSSDDRWDALDGLDL